MLIKIKNYIFRGNNESGRSMVEMLGVLAIIGVLTVGGLAGYNYAMEKNKVNELINGAMRRAVVVAGMGRTGTVSLDEFSEDTIAAGTFGNTATVSGGKITLTVSGVEEKICNRLKTTLGDNAIMTVVEECGADPLTLAFNHDLQKGVSAEGTGTPNTPEEGLQEWRECESDADCTGPCEHCLGQCVKLMDGSNGCTACADNEFSMEDPELGTACFPCTLNDYTMPDFLCNQCSNREYDTTRDMCLFKNCPSGYTNGNGVCIENCQSGHIRDIDGECTPCNASEEFIEVPQGSNCSSICNNREMIGNEQDGYACALKCESGYERAPNGECALPCQTGYEWNSDGECVLPCPTGTKSTGLGGYATTLDDGTMCYCETKDTVYDVTMGQCKAKPGNCTSYRDCNNGEYCNFSSACGTSGSCRTTSSVQSAAGSIVINGTNHHAVCSSTAVNSYYRAEDWCAALGGRLLSSSEICDTNATSFTACPENTAHETNRVNIQNLCHAGFGSNWYWASRPDNDRTTCKMFSVAINFERPVEGHGNYEYGQKSDRRGFCLLP